MHYAGDVIDHDMGMFLRPSSSLVEERVIDVAPEETVDEDGLSLRVVPQRRRSKTRVEETADLVEISCLLVRAHVIVVTAGGDVIQAATVLWGRYEFARFRYRVYTANAF